MKKKAIICKGACFRPNFFWKVRNIFQTFQTFQTSMFHNLEMECLSISILLVHFHIVESWKVGKLGKLGKHAPAVNSRLCELRIDYLIEDG